MRLLKAPTACALLGFFLFLARAGAFADTERPFVAFTVGAIQCLSISDGYYDRPPKRIAPDVPPDEIKKFLSSQGADPDVIRTPTSCLLLRLPDGMRVLVDSGMGLNAGPGSTRGRFGENLALAGVASDSISAVLISHLHPDHIGALFDADGEPAFPNARYYVSLEEVNFWSQSPDLSSSRMPPAAQKRAIDAAQRFLGLAEGRLEIFTLGTDPIEWVRSIALPGHTPGMAGFIFESRGQTLIYTADAGVEPNISLRRPEWRSAGDADPNEAADTREKLFSGIMNKLDWQCFAPHFPQFGVGRVVEYNDLPRWRPMIR